MIIPRKSMAIATSIPPSIARTDNENIFAWSKYLIIFTEIMGAFREIQVQIISSYVFLDVIIRIFQANYNPDHTNYSNDQ